MQAAVTLLRWPLPWGLLDGAGAAVLVLLPAAWVVWGRARLLVVASLTVGLADLAGARVLKPLVGRARPCQVDARVAAHVADAGSTCGSGPSFPSNHALNTAALAAVTASPLLGGVAIVAGTSRVILGEHYPSDVAGGWALGAALGLGVRAGLRRTAWCPSAPSSSTPPTPSSGPASPSA